MPPPYKLKKVEKVLPAQKLAALTFLVKHMEGTTMLPLEWEGHQGLVFLIMLVLATSGLPQIQYASAGLMLRMFFPKWRNGAPRNILGRIVERCDPEVQRWRESVLARDARKCRECGSGERLEAHHVVRWVDAPDLRLDLDNGLTLCHECHLLKR